MAEQSSAASSVSGESTGSRKYGRCKWFNVAKGWGFITPEDGGKDVFVHQSVIKMNGFRSLAEEERIEFEFIESDKGYEATLVTGINGLSCSGSIRANPKKYKKIRCFNCGEFGNHVAAKCVAGPQPKKCHYCKSTEHLIKDCVAREQDEAVEVENVVEEATKEVEEEKDNE